MRKFFLLPGAASVLFVGFAVAVTARYESTQPFVRRVAEVAIPDGAAGRLAGSLRIQTISSEDPAAFDPRTFSALHRYLQTAFPRVHARLARETVGTHSLLYTWPGSDASLNPILLIGHLDVVPVEPGTQKQWQHDPFGGRIADGFIWGRGAIDNKSAVVGTLEAVEMLLAEDFRPVRTVYLAYGHDEEVGGAAGARQIAALLKARGVELETVLDEGGVIGDGILPGIAEPVALVGIAEKGFVTIELSTRMAGGHSSLPPRQSAVGILSAAVARLEANPMAARLEGPDTPTIRADRPKFPGYATGSVRESLVDRTARVANARRESHHQCDGANDHGADDLPSGNERQRAPQLRQGGHQLPDPARRHRRECRGARQAYGRR
jgi:carboxypeptidase PM20D1